MFCRLARKPCCAKIRWTSPLAESAHRDRFSIRGPGNFGSTSSSPATDTFDIHERQRLSSGLRRVETRLIVQKGSAAIAGRRGEVTHAKSGRRYCCLRGTHHAGCSDSPESAPARSPTHRPSVFGRKKDAVGGAGFPARFAASPAARIADSVPQVEWPLGPASWRSAAILYRQLPAVLVLGILTSEPTTATCC